MLEGIRPLRIEPMDSAINYGSSDQCHLKNRRRMARIGSFPFVERPTWRSKSRMCRDLDPFNNLLPSNDRHVGNGARVVAVPKDNSYPDKQQWTIIVEPDGAWKYVDDV